MVLWKEQIGGIIFLVVCAACVIDFWMGGASDDGAGGFSILWFYIIIPITAFITGIMYGKKDGKAKWIYIIVCGLMGMFLGWITFSLANTIAFGNWHMPSYSDAYNAGFPAIVGMFIGHFLWHANKD